MKEKVAIFGAGKFGKEAYNVLCAEGKEVAFFIDNNKALHGSKIEQAEVIGLDDYIKMNCGYKIVVACYFTFQLEIEEELKKNGIDNYEFYDRDAYHKRQRLLSYSAMNEMEDVILYHVLKNEKEIFYIDVGSNDPYYASVTKLLYDMKNAHGINIEPQSRLYRISCNERPRDINLQVGLGSEEGKMQLCVQEGYSTVVKDNILSDKFSTEEITITTLKNVCEKYLGKEETFSFLKVDVEGYEKEVLLGADFKKYRPYIVVMESFHPISDIPCHDKWESILIENGYHFVYERGVNRYYVANENEEEAKW